jgi:excisionase family DNA binding protein
VLSLEQFAEVLGISRATAYRWWKSGELPIPVFKVGRTPTVRLADVEAHLESLANDARDQQFPVRRRRSA